MRKIYDSKYAQNLLKKFLPNHFRIVNDKTSNGYKFFNSLYGIEHENLKDYIDQAAHFSSFENFDYGTDFDYYILKLPIVIQSGYIYGDNIPIKIATNDDFIDGKPTRIVYNSGYSINLSGYINNEISGFIGIEYMRNNKNGSGILYLNSIIDTNTAIINNTYQSYSLPLSDLIIPKVNSISGYNLGIEYQNYNKQQRYELLTPETSDILSVKYAFTKTVRLPYKGDNNNTFRNYIVDYYEPEAYYWDNQLNTYKPIIPLANSFLDKDEKSIYYRQALNNPYGSGNFNTVYLALEHIPISGTLKLFDIDTLISGQMTEIPNSGRNIYKYSAYESGEISPYYVYLGYDEYVPLEERLGFPASGTIYKNTSWDYIREQDGLVNFDWVEHPQNSIINGIKIINPLSRYVVEYTYVVNKNMQAISTHTGTKYVKYDNKDHLYNIIDTNNNVELINNSLSVEKEKRRAITFNGLEIRPGTIINEVNFKGVMTKEKEITSSSSINADNIIIPGYCKNVLPYIKEYNIELLNHNYLHRIFTPVSGIINDVFIDKSIGDKIYYNNNGLYNDIYYDFYNENLNSDKILRIKFKSNSSNNNYLIISSNNSDTTGWKISYKNGFIEIMDNLSTIMSSITKYFNNDIIELIFVAIGNINSTYNSLRYELYISINNNFFEKIELYEANSNSYVGDNITKTIIFKNINIDLDFIKIYNEGLVI